MTSVHRPVDGAGVLTPAGGTAATLAYDALGRLRETVAGAATTRFLYDGLDAIGEYNASNVLQRRYVHGPGVDEPLVWYEGAGTGDVRWLMHDERGSIVAINAAANSVNAYDEFGTPAATNTGRFQYTGQMWLGEAGLYHYKARAYLPALGRFAQTDPIGFAGGMNLYAYVANDPINARDPLGLDEDEIVVTGCGPECQRALRRALEQLRRELEDAVDRIGDIDPNTLTEILTDFITELVCSTLTDPATTPERWLQAFPIGGPYTYTSFTAQGLMPGLLPAPGLSFGVTHFTDRNTGERTYAGGWGFTAGVTNNAGSPMTSGDNMMRRFGMGGFGSSITWGYADQANINLAVAHSIGNSVAVDWGISGSGTSFGGGFGAGSLVTVTSNFPNTVEVECGDAG